MHRPLGFATTGGREAKANRSGTGAQPRILGLLWATMQLGSKVLFK